MAGRKGVALSVASGGAAASSDDGPSRLEKLKAFTSKNFFLLGMMVAVALARAFPHVSCMLLSITLRTTARHSYLPWYLTHPYSRTLFLPPPPNNL